MIVIYFQAPAYGGAEALTRYRLVVKRGDSLDIEACGIDKLGHEAWGRAEPDDLEPIDIMQRVLLDESGEGVHHIHLGDL